MIPGPGPAKPRVARVGYWLTPAGCLATGGHTPHVDGRCVTCTVCGTIIPPQGGAR